MCYYLHFLIEHDDPRFIWVGARNEKGKDEWHYLSDYEKVPRDLISTEYIPVDPVGEYKSWAAMVLGEEGLGDHHLRNNFDLVCEASMSLC